MHKLYRVTCINYTIFCYTDTFLLPSYSYRPIFNSFLKI